MLDKPYHQIKKDIEAEVALAKKQADADKWVERSRVESH